MNIYEIRKKANQEEIDYLFLKSALQDLKYPRDKITQLLRRNALIRVKKGLYVFGTQAAQKPYHLEVLANLIYGPSAISLEYALAYYGFIPERVCTVTSITTKRHKNFSTPVGEFTYSYLPPEKYTVGITQKQHTPNHRFLIATPEKAFADVLTLSLDTLLQNKKELSSFLLDDLRIDETQLKTLDLSHLKEIMQIYHHPNINLLMEYLSQ